MCGILGQINFTGEIVDSNFFKKSLDSMSHRGPDGDDIFFRKNIAFGHKRLSIIDLRSVAKQPMLSDCGKYVIIFNGEIYNYKEIREELICLGCKFKTCSDTEVLLQAFIYYKEKCLDKLIGMFAFSIYNIETGELFLCRDRLGIKPLYYSLDNDKVIFSSEVKAILVLEGRKRKLNKKAVSSYFSFRYPILNDSFFEGIQSLEAGNYMYISSAGVAKKKRYWGFESFFKEQSKDLGEQYYIDEINRLLKSSVNYRMISDVPVGAFLSGGVDSSAVVSLMAMNSSRKIKTFSVGYKSYEENEFDYADLVAEKYNTDHQNIEIDPRHYIDTMLDLIKLKAAPLSVPNEVPLYLMSKELKKEITVVLSGEGADEIFGGYGRIFRSPYDYERHQDLTSYGFSKEQAHLFLESFKKRYGDSSFDNEVDFFLSIYRYISNRSKASFLGDEFNVDDIDLEFEDFFKAHFKNLEGDTFYNKIMYVFEKVHLLGLLGRVDSSTMATSVEARVPFVDHRLVEFSFTIPVKYKLKWAGDLQMQKARFILSDEISEKYDTPKYILKKAFEDKLPKEVLYRKKVGFPVPLNEWFKGDFLKYAKETLVEGEAVKRGVFNINSIEKLLETKNNIDQKQAMQLWMMINLELFLVEFKDYIEERL
ncbi:MAG: asparagine synthase (glutamine-hydrolyzing) [Bacteriovoracaceae bacterium]|jgi:asparagine synthase (glutamine-hydrolysing)|nr:asparagine synthase (glutamine-hydrolyzing) [Bacteriovoracaceae bacterium]